MEISIRFIVDEAHCQKATGELYDMLLRQDRAMVDRWYQRLNASDLIIKILSWLGTLASLLGFALCIFAVVENWKYGVAIQGIAWSVLFLIFTVAFQFVSRLRKPIYEWGQRRSASRCRKHAARIMKQAARLVPYEANFELKGDLLIYSRCKNDQWTFAWQRSLKNFAAKGLVIQGSNVTTVFRRPTSLYPAIAILHQQSDWLTQALTEIGIATAKTSNDTAQPDKISGNL